MKSNDPTSEGPVAGLRESDLNYPTPGNSREICLVWPDGKMMAWGYVFLVSKEYDPSLSQITLGFTSHVATLNGADLQGLFIQILNQEAKFIICADKRYNQVSSSTIVNEIKVASL